MFKWPRPLEAMRVYCRATKSKKEEVSGGEQDFTL